jgi:hypothetical protein
LLDDAWRSEIRHQQRRNKYRDNNGFNAIDGDIGGCADSGQKKCKDTFKRKLQKLNESNRS